MVLTRTLRLKIVISFLIVAVIPFAAISVSSYLQIKKGTNNIIRENLDQLSFEIAIEIERTVFNGCMHVKALSENWTIRSKHIPVETKLDEMKKVQYYHDIFDNIMLIGNDGIVLASTSKEYQQEGWMFSEWFKQAQNGNVVISNVHAALNPFRLVLAVLVPVKGADGKVNAVLAGCLKMKNIWEIIDRVQIGSTGIAFLIDNKGNIIASRNRKELLYKLNPALLREEILDHVTGMVEYVSDKGVKRLCHYYTLKGYREYEGQGWQLCIMQDVREAFDTVSGMQRQVMLVACMGLGLIFLLASILSRNLSESVKNLAQAANKIASGDLSVQVPVRSHDEIGDLSHAFNSMAEELKEKTKAMEDRAKALEEARIEADTANRAKSDFLANMSHEIRTPLNGIIGMAELAGETKLTADQKEIFTTISAEATILLDLINKILDFSKIEAGRLELEDIPFDLRNTIEHSIDSLSIQATQKGLELIFFLPDDIPTELVGDPARLKQIFLNLTGNALKFTHEGEIYIDAKLLEDNKDTSKIRFSVRDSGIGISPDKLKTIFESFTQADGSTTRKYGGTGLGTTIAKQLAELMGGEMGVQSEEGIGSTFWFTAVFKKQKFVADRENQNLKGVRVLFVDDNQTNRFILKEYLKSWDCIPVESSSGQEALECINKSIVTHESFDLIITDMQMPEMNGFELSQKIKNMEEARAVPIIVLTSTGMKGDKDKCHLIGINGCATKPVKRDELRRVIEFVLGCIPSEKDHVAEERSQQTDQDWKRKDKHILLVEDYPTNQQVALKYLSSEGYRVSLAENGLEAFEACKEKQYDLILMDVQMPIMDGYEATRKIRDYEKNSDEYLSRNSKTKDSVPIIAMTAHAIKEDRERCLASGMNDYMAKPLRKAEVLAMVDKWINIEVNDNAKVREKFSSEHHNDYHDEALVTGLSLDYIKALENFDGDETFLNDIFGGFLENCKVQIKKLEVAIANQDSEEIRIEAHSMKGGAANLTASGLAGVAFELEQIGKRGDLDEGAAVLEKIKKEVYALETFTMNNTK